jgi:hypothetical protein
MKPGAGQAEIREPARVAGRDNPGMLDPVSGRSGLRHRRDGKDNLLSRNAVHGDRPPRLASAADQGGPAGSPRRVSARSRSSSSLAPIRCITGRAVRACSTAAA